MATPQIVWDNAAVKLVLQRVENLNRKILPTDTEASKTLRDVAEFYIANYSGTFEFMLSLQRQYNNGYTLSASKLAGALNCLVSEAKYLRVSSALTPPPAAFQLPTEVLVTIPSAPAPAPEPTDVTPVVLDGTYTVVMNERGEYRTLKVVSAELEQRIKYNLPAGAQIVSYLNGQDNEGDYTGFAFVKGGKAAAWSRFKTDSTLVNALNILIKADKEGQIDMGHAYALESGRCWRCGRKLTVPASISRGLGPICAVKI